LSILLLSSKTNKHIYLLLGCILAFLIVDGIAIAAGSWVTSIVPVRFVKIVSGVVFIVFGAIMLLRKEKEEKQKKFYDNAFLSGFILILLTEWGDKTQISSAIFATKFNPILVLIGTMIALTLVSVLAVFFGKFISERVNKKTITKVAAVVFIIMGVAFFFL
jgi:putative Ca2+/H+ antiporter (TMEM165/GDT1 family)